MKEISRINGFLGIVFFIIIGYTLSNFVSNMFPNYRDNFTVLILNIVIIVTVLIGMATSLFVLRPNEGLISILFGKYNGELVKDGFHFLNPFATYIKYDLRLNNMETSKLKINDKNGAPLDISMVFSFQIVDMKKVTFNVTDLHEYMKQQIEAITRNLIKEHTFAEIVEQVDEISHKAVEKANKELENVGVKFLTANLINMAYSPEMAQAMLRKQQALAIVDAKKELVKGVTGIVEELMSDLNTKNELSKEEKSKLTSNMLIILLSDKEVTPTINVS